VSLPSRIRGAHGLSPDRQIDLVTNPGLGSAQYWISSRVAARVYRYLWRHLLTKPPSSVCTVCRSRPSVSRVLWAVSDRPYSTAADIDAVVRADIGAVSLPAVYNAVATLTDKGIIRRIQPGGSPARYEDRVGDNHHHLICRTCSRMGDVDCAVGHTPCLTAVDGSGYVNDEAEVISCGGCPDCVAAAVSAAG
jgi:Fe2+ or Zn2+ uptake regulation protein